MCIQMVQLVHYLLNKSMETIEIRAFLRDISVGKSATNRLRRKGLIPCVLYGNQQEKVHLYIEGLSLLRLIQAKQAHFIRLRLDGEKNKEENCVLQDIQYHPVSDALLHADFLRLGTKPLVMRIPISSQGMAEGVLQGGKLHTRMRALRIRALPKHMPSSVVLDVSHLSLGDSIRVEAIKTADFEIMENPSLTVLSVQVPKALKSAESEAATEASKEGVEEESSGEEKKTS